MPLSLESWDLPLGPIVSLFQYQAGLVSLVLVILGTDGPGKTHNLWVEHFGKDIHAP